MSKSAGRIYHLAMPKWLRDTKLERPLRVIATFIKKLGVLLERKLRNNKVMCNPGSIKPGIWLDYDFIIRHTPPEIDPLLASLVKFLKPGQVFYDIGGYVGWYAIIAALRIGEIGRVITFEPVPESAALLRKHIFLNGLQDRIRIVETACSDRNGVVSMATWSLQNTTWSSGNALRNVYPNHDISPEEVAVTCICLDDFVMSGSPIPNILKIDVEGAELWVLRGAKQLLLENRPWVFLEIHAFAWPIFSTTEQDLRAFLQEVRYRLATLDDISKNLIDIPEYGHAILIPE